jgi:hypothetical protein
MMDRVSEEHTSTTLLGRLRQAPSDQAAWADTVERHGSRSTAGAGNGSSRRPMPETPPRIS